ncbi:hypothetical protein SCHPADRAFT_885305 [Schizopora paradoxa]|uniref:Uncharacterized protein n=1 Tax=Schizopora paradoxa TaxID=27342 RepID=A0A0H2S6W4_9AGAM|nr:hypothetical protein SCHPADRAFT_885305 [Schizopora paradoxa]
MFEDIQWKGRSVHSLLVEHVEGDSATKFSINVKISEDLLEKFDDADPKKASIEDQFCDFILDLLKSIDLRDPHWKKLDVVMMFWTNALPRTKAIGKWSQDLQAHCFQPNDEDVEAYLEGVSHRLHVSEGDIVSRGSDDDN